MNNFIKKLIYIFILLLLPLNIFALTLNEAIQNALNYNYLIISKKHEILSNSSKTKAAKALKMPSFFLKSSYNQFDSNKTILFNTPIGEQSIKISEKEYIQLTTGVKLNLYTGGLISANIDAAKQNIFIKKEQLLETKLDIAYNTAIAYLNILELQALKKIAEKHLNSLIKHKNDSYNFYKQGIVPYIDVLQTDVKVKEAIQKLTSIENNIKTAKTNLSLIMGKSYDFKYNIEKLNLNIKKNLNLKPLIKIAKENRPILKEFQIKIKQMNSFIKAKNSELKPKLTLIGGYNYSNAQNDINKKGNFLIQAVLSFNLNWTNALHEINSLKESKFALKNIKKDILSSVILGVKKAYEDYQTALSNLKVSKSAIKSADEYYRIVNLKYKEGLADNSDVLDAEALKTDALMKEKINYFNVLKKYFLIKRVTGKEVENYE